MRWPNNLTDKESNARATLGQSSSKMQRMQRVKNDSSAKKLAYRGGFSRKLTLLVGKQSHFVRAHTLYSTHNTARDTDIKPRDVGLSTSTVATGGLPFGVEAFRIVSARLAKTTRFTGRERLQAWSRRSCGGRRIPGVS